MGPHEPYWRTNTSFSPPPSRWDFRLQSEGISYGLHDDQLYGSSTSSSSKESRSWMRGNHLPSHRYSASDGAGPYYSSPSDISQAQQWTPPTIQGMNIDDYHNARRDPISERLSSTPTMEGTSAVPDSGGSSSSRSDGSDFEPISKSLFSTHHRNFSTRRSFMSKAIYPLSLPTLTPAREISDTSATSFLEFDDSTPHRDTNRWSSASGSMDFTDVSEQFDSEIHSQPEVIKCGLCERFLSQKSPWSSRRIVRSGDFPVAGVLSCRHVFHAECLDQTTPKTRKTDPPCPLCARSDEEYTPELRVFSKLKNGFPRTKPSSEDGPSRPWGCTQVGDCVEGALHAPSRNTMLLLNRNRLKKNLSLKGNSSKEISAKLKKSGSLSSQLFSGKSGDQGAVGCSKTTAGPSMNR